MLGQQAQGLAFGDGFALLSATGLVAAATALRARSAPRMLALSVAKDAR